MVIFNSLFIQIAERNMWDGTSLYTEICIWFLEHVLKIYLIDFNRHFKH